MDAFLKECQEIQALITTTYEEGVSLEHAERLAARFLALQMTVAEHLRAFDLDCRMRKSGLKAVKSAVYMEEAKRSDKKPSDAFLQNMVDMSELVQGEQRAFDEAEVERDALQNYFNIFKEAHIYYRGIAKGRFE